MATKKKAQKLAVSKNTGPTKAPVVKQKVASKAAPNGKVVSKAASKKAPASKATPKNKVVTKVSTVDKGSAIQRTAALQIQVEDLKNEAAMELKERLSAAREVVSELENQMSSLTGKPAETRSRQQR